jgi:demethylmenaquinone methyltransferase/2-methoxy-6-polyprenyl-1,4-benzoquinol methylase
VARAVTAGVPERARAEASEQKRRIRGMFDAVAPRYDFLNHLLSLGIDRRWRKRAVRALMLRPGDLVLDLCAGTGDLGLAALDAASGVRVIGVDLARAMLARGEEKRGRQAMLFVQGDAERVPLPDASVDAACVGFGIRNVASLPDAFAETARVLRPGGRFAVLEFTTPPNRVFRGLYHAYFHRVLPMVGGMVSGRPGAYRYLPESVARFPDPPALAALASDAGFAEARWELLSGGIAALHVCRR